MTASPPDQSERGFETPGLVISEETKYTLSSKSRRPPSIDMIILVIAVVACLVVATFAWYLMQSSLHEECVCSGDPCNPVSFTSITMSGTPPSNYTVSWLVAWVQCPYIVSFDSFKISIYMNGTRLTEPKTIFANSTMLFGTDVKVIISDREGNGKLTPADRFLVYGMDGARTWVFNLIWAADESLLWNMGWSTP